MKRGCLRGRASKFADSTFERMMRKYEWRLWLGFDWSPGFSFSIRRSLERIRPRAWRWRLKIWPNRIWPSESARKGQDFYDTAGVIIIPYCKFSSENPRIFSYAELYIATKGFSKHELLGSGGFGSVYKAVLPSDGSIVAVKCVSERGERRLEKSFEAELAAVGQLRHKNLVSLKGWCFEEDELLLVYDYMPNSSLDRLLFVRRGPVLEWQRRYKIVGGLAAALYYLHEQLETQILHRDVKTSNVMLDSGFNARLGDFGLARWLDHAGNEFETHKTKNYNNNSIRDFRLAESSRIGGTIGYISPESFQRRSKSTAKSDVFSFGVVALEMASGRRAIDLSYPDEQIVLVDWVRGLYEDGRLLEAGDPRLSDGSYNLHELNRLLYIGLLCTLNDPSGRPTMKWIIQALHGEVELPALPSFKALPFYASLSSGSSESLSITDNNDSSKLLTSSSSGSRKPKSVSSDGEEKKINGANPRNYVQLVDAPREFSLSEVLAATANFSDDMMVAEMDFGTAYHGVLRDSNLRVLVKRLGIKTCPALRSRFAHELCNLGRLRHRNLVQLRGWCTEKGEVLVIYEYMMNRSLSKMLFFQKKSVVLDWASRYHIVKGLAAGLLYLHEEWEQTVVHKSVTSGNVFLDSDMNPRLGGFALAEFLNQGDDKHASSGSVRGIFGYMSPEYVASGRATTDADVFSFGVVVLEVVCGRMAVDFRCPQVLLVQWIRNLERNGMLSSAMDVRLQGSFDVKEMTRLLNVGLVCTRNDSKARPTMRQITHILDGDDRLLMSVQALSGNTEPERDSTSGDAALLIRRMQALGIQ